MLQPFQLGRGAEFAGNHQKQDHVAAERERSLRALILAHPAQEGGDGKQRTQSVDCREGEDQKDQAVS